MFRHGRSIFGSFQFVFIFLVFGLVLASCTFRFFYSKDISTVRIVINLALFLVLLFWFLVRFG